MRYRRNNCETDNFSHYTKRFGLKSSSPETAIDLRLPGWIGNHLVRLERTKKGLKYYDEALEKNPNDVNVLLRRANANVKCFRICRGTDDIENALQLDPSNINAASELMNYMYLNGKFENSMLLGVRNSKIRKQPPYFSFGVLRAKNTIENCVGKKAGHPLRDHYEIIRELAWLKNMSMQKGKPKRKINHMSWKNNRTSKASAPASIHPPKSLKPYRMTSQKELHESPVEESVSACQVKNKAEFSAKFAQLHCDSSSVCLIKPIYRTFSAEIEITAESVQSMESSLEDSIAEHKSVLKLPKVVTFPYQPLQRRTKNIDNFLSCSYLGELFQEKQFLTALPKTPGCEGKNPDANNMLHDASTNGLTILDTTKEILRTRKPFYHIKYQENQTKSKKVEMDKLKLLERRRLRSIKKINYYFETIARHVQNMDLYHMSKTAELMYQYCKTTDKKVLQNRDYVLCRLYRLVGDGFFLSNKFLPEMTPNQMFTRMDLAMGFHIRRTNSQESLYKRIIGRSFKWTDLISTYEQRVKSCKYIEELIWLYHELARFNIELGKLSMAKNNAVKCTYEARKYEESRWALNGYMLMIKIAVRQKNKRDANRHLRNALNTAKILKNEECMQVMDEHSFDGPKIDDLIKQRQTKIVGLLDTYEKRRGALNLFGYMLSKPVKRRLPMVPGLVNIDESFMQDKKEEKGSETNEIQQSVNRGKEAERMISSYLLPSDALYQL